MTEYLVKSMFCFLSLYLGYVVFFKNSRNYHINRVVLLFSVFFTLLVPILNITRTTPPIPGIEQKKQLFKVLSYPIDFSGSEPVNTVLESNSSDLFFLVSVIYAFISSILLLRFTFNICTLLLKEYRSKKIYHNGIQLTLMDEKANPFTFFRTIFISRTYYQEKSMEEELILHEIAHKKQLHSIDVVIIELVQVFFWFNPFVYLFKRLIKANHEYLADDFVLRSGICQRAYSHKLLNYTFKSKISGLASGFNHLLIKNRLLMLSKSNQKRQAAYHLFFFVPLIVVLFLTTAFKNTDGAIPGTKPGQEQGYFYADKLSWSTETKEIQLKGKIRVMFGRNDFTADGGFSGFDPVYLLLFNNQKVAPNTFIDVSGLKCDIVKLTEVEATKKYGSEGKLGAIEIYTSK